MRWCFNDNSEIPSRVSYSVEPDSFLRRLSHRCGPGNSHAYLARIVFKSSLVEDNPSVTSFIVAIKERLVSEGSIPLGKDPSQNPDV